MSRPSRYAPHTSGRAEHWSDHAACRDAPPTLFFPEGTLTAIRYAVAQAKGYCRECVVLEPCLTAALERPEAHGVWGGLDEFERQALRKEGAGHAG